MGPQFAHIQTFSRKPNPAGQSVDQVFDEVERVPEFSKHVDSPEPPRIVDGVSIAQLRRNHADMIDGAATQVRAKDGVKVRAIRRDRHTLMSMVASYPLTWEQIGDDPEEQAALDDWRRANVEFAKRQFGEGYQCSIEHTDEAHPHLHIYALPIGLPGIDAKLMHPGKAAKASVEAQAKADGRPAKEAITLANAAYKDAMRAWQDGYYLEVGEPSGLLRDGPRRKRQSRADYQRDKRDARLRSRSALVERHEQLAEQEGIAAASMAEAEAKAISLIESAKVRALEVAAEEAAREHRAAETRRLHRADVQRRWDARREARLAARSERLDRRAADLTEAEKDIQSRKADIASLAAGATSMIAEAASGTLQTDVWGGIQLQDPTPLRQHPRELMPLAEALVSTSRRNADLADRERAVAARERDLEERATEVEQLEKRVEAAWSRMSGLFQSLKRAIDWVGDSLGLRLPANLATAVQEISGEIEDRARNDREIDLCM